MDRIAIGKIGESYAENFLNSLDYLIMEKNFHCRWGEVDLIAIDGCTRIPQLVFIEVKTRTSDLFGQPEESISHQKIAKIIKTAIHFKDSSSKNLPHIWRIDAIAVKLNKDLKLREIRHLKNISDGY